MNKTDLVRHVAGETGMTGAAAGNAVEAVLSGVADSLSRGEAVTLPGFGTILTRDRPARTRRNPRTGESVGIAASTAPAFKPGKPLRDAVNGARA